MRLPYWTLQPLGTIKVCTRNLEGTLLHPEVVDDYLKAEIASH